MNKANGYIGILVASRAQRKYILRQYLKFNAAPYKLFCFIPSSIDWKNRRIEGLHFIRQKWAIGRFPFPEVVYNRCYGTHREIVERLTEMIGEKKCFNRINQFNKLDIYDCLNQWLYDYLPDTVAYRQGNAFDQLQKHTIVYFKPFYGHKGKGVYRAELKSTGDILVGHHYFSPEVILNDGLRFEEYISNLLGSTPYVIQKGIRIRKIGGQTFDIRALVQKNEQGLWSVTNLVSRIAFKESYNTSIYVKARLSDDVLNRLYSPGRVDEIKTSIYNISLRTAEILDHSALYHLGEFSVDIALDEDAHPWIIELNGKPQKDLYHGICRRSIVYQRPIQYAKYLCRQ